jgi:protein TonB
MPVTKTASPLPAPGQYLSVTQPSYASKVEPDYPTSARRLHQQGTVVLGLYINALGTLDKIEVIKSSGYPLLDQAAMDAMKQSGFHPAYQDNTPVPSHAEVSVTFQLQ